MSDKPTWIELESIIPLRGGEGKTSVRSVTGLSDDTIKRNFPKLIVKLSTRRMGMKLKHALMIANGTPRVATPRKRQPAAVLDGDFDDD